MPPLSVFGQHLQTSQKPQSQLPNFIWGLHGMGEWRSHDQNTNGPGHMTKIGLPSPYKLKFFKNVILQNQKADDLKTWNAALSFPMLPRLAAWHKLYEGLNILELLLVLALHSDHY